jgi:hypothetical protein
MIMGTIACETVESMINIIIMLTRENITFRADEKLLTIYVKGY